MSTISIHSEIQSGNARRYRAIAGNRQVLGATRGEALDALTADWGDEVQETVILIERFEPDAFFSEAQQQRKQELMTRRSVLTTEERAELENLLDAELDATVARTDRLVS